MFDVVCDPTLGRLRRTPIVVPSVQRSRSRRRNCARPAPPHSTSQSAFSSSSPRNETPSPARGEEGGHLLSCRWWRYTHCPRAMILVALNLGRPNLPTENQRALRATPQSASECDHIHPFNHKLTQAHTHTRQRASQHSHALAIRIAILFAARHVPGGRRRWVAAQLATHSAAAESTAASSPVTECDLLRPR